VATWTDTAYQAKMLARAKKRVERDWLFWKPIAFNVLTYSEACACNTGTLLEANIVADMKAGK
jgi:hypothetical protein